MHQDTEHIILLMKEAYSADLSIYDDAFIKQTLISRMLILSLDESKDYLSLLKTHPDEAEELIMGLKNSYSEFFRDKTTFSLLEQYLLPGLFKKKKYTKPSEIRVWSAACAAGQEPYSVAILLEDYVRTFTPGVSFRIFATDLNPACLQSAKEGIYEPETLRNISLAHYQRYFSPCQRRVRIHESVRNTVDFSLHDLTDENLRAPTESIYGDFDLIFCANILFYYQPMVRRKIMETLRQTLIPGGYLITGEAETSIVADFRELHPIMPPAPIFQKIEP